MTNPKGSTGVSPAMPSPDGGPLALLQHTEGSSVWLLVNFLSLSGMLERLEERLHPTSYSSILANMNSSAGTAELRSGRITGKPEVMDMAQQT
jgi:hypothetical protein